MMIALQIHILEHFTMLRYFIIILVNKFIFSIE